VRLKLLRVLSRVVNSILGVFGLYVARSSSPSAWWAHERSPELRHSRLYVGATYSPWLSDREFLSAYEIIKDFTLVDRERCYEIWDLAKQSIKVDGAILEVGVWRGGTGCLLAMSAPTKSIYLADTFEGVVKAGKNDTYYMGGEHADTSVQVVSRLLASAGVDNVRLLKGIFPDETAAELEGPISLLHVDVDVYQSAKDIVEWALPRLPVGAKIVFDDYGFYESGGVTRLVNELRGSWDSFEFVYNLNGHAILIRTRML
jgi:O-methyltransferase